MANTQVEMRAFERVALCCPADLMRSGAAEAEHVFVTDLSEAGAFAQTRLKLRRGELLTMRLRLDEEKVVTLPCEVSWARPFEPVSIDGYMAGLGLRFRDVGLSEQRLLRSHVLQMLKNNKGAAKAPAPAKQAPAQAVQRSRPVASPAAPAQACASSGEHITQPGKYGVASMSRDSLGSSSSTHDIGAWHDTLVDEPSLSLPPEGSLSLGCEPALGDLDLQSMSKRRASHHGTSIFPRGPRSWTPWLAAGSLLMGIAAGGVYGLMAPGPVAQTEIVQPLQQAQNPPAATPQQGKTAPDKLAKTEKKDIKTNTYKHNTKDSKTAGKHNKLAQKHSKKPAKATPQANSAKAGPLLVGILSGPVNTGRGWFVSVRGGASALHNFTLDGPPRAVIDLSTELAAGLKSQQIARGPFKSLRVGKGGGKVRLVFDLAEKTSTKNVRFTNKGRDLLIEIPREATAQR